jgi:ubiquinone biosynthesis protein UbiJ
MLDQLPLAVLNHLLGDANWARERLAPFAGSSVKCEVGPFSTTFSIMDSGKVREADRNTEPAATIRLAAFTALRLIVFKDDSARNEVDVEGDAALAGVLTRVLLELRWDVEEDISRVVGDIAAHRLVATGRSFLEWQRNTANSLARSAGEYVSEERALVAGREALREFVQSVDDLRDDIERLDKRIERLLQARAPRTPASR